MAERLVEQRVAIESYCAKYQRRLSLDEETYSMLTEFVRLYCPLESASKQVCVIFFDTY
jgi:hypothetical protein